MGIGHVARTTYEVAKAPAEEKSRVKATGLLTNDKDNMDPIWDRKTLNDYASAAGSDSNTIFAGVIIKKTEQNAGQEGNNFCSAAAGLQLLRDGSKIKAQQVPLENGDTAILCQKTQEPGQD